MRAAVALLALVAMVGDAHAQAPGCDPVGWREVLAAHAARYPQMGFDDTYKLIHQGVFGSEHAAPDEASARAWLVDEIAAVGTPDRGAEAIVEPIAPGGTVVRVHLRPYLAAGGDQEALLQAFLATARGVHGSVDAFRCAASVAPDVDPLRWPADEWRAFVEDLVGQALPAVHHSGPFTEAYAPAYRVVAGDLARRLLRGGR